MRLEYDGRPETKPEMRWWASADEGGHEATGSTPLDATVALAELLEAELAKFDPA